jgi:hypothetical protein
VDTDKKEDSFLRGCVAADQIKDILQIVESSESERFVGNLFRRKFGGDPPEFPKHFIAMYSRDRFTWEAVGYVNFWQRHTAFMGGGLVIEDRAYRSMPKAHREIIRSCGGIAEYLLKTSLKMLPDNDVVWGYVGDTRAERVDMKVGFEHTHIDKLIAYWTKAHSAEEKIRLTDEIAAVGPF